MKQSVIAEETEGRLRAHETVSYSRGHRGKADLLEGL